MFLSGIEFTNATNILVYYLLKTGANGHLSTFTISASYAFLLILLINTKFNMEKNPMVQVKNFTLYTK